MKEAVEYLNKATKIETNNAQFFYVYGLALESFEPEKAQKAIDSARLAHFRCRFLHQKVCFQISTKSYSLGS